MNPMRIIFVLVLIFLLSFNSVHPDAFDSENKNVNISCFSEGLDSLLNILPIIDVHEVDKFHFHKGVYEVGYEIGYEMFVEIYQADSLIQRNREDDPLPILLGKTNKDGLNALIVVRFFGEWFATIDFLTFDTMCNLKGFMILAAYGGDEGYEYVGTGYFENDNTYLYTGISFFEDEFGFKVNCSKDIERYSIKSDGEIIVLCKSRKIIDCDEIGKGE